MSVPLRRRSPVSRNIYDGRAPCRDISAFSPLSRFWTESPCVVVHGLELRLSVYLSLSFIVGNDGKTDEGVASGTMIRP